MTNQEARDYFKNCNLSYNDITINDLYYLISILNKEMFNDSILLMMNEPKIKGKDKNIIFKNNKLIFAALKCKGDYFESREAITFNKNGFIGFCGWADDKRANIFISGFIEWCNYLMLKKLDRYQNNLYEKLAEDIEPDPEDFYLAEIEGKAKEYDKFKSALKDIRKIISRYDFENYHYFKERLIEDNNKLLQIIEKAGVK